MRPENKNNLLRYRFCNGLQSERLKNAKRIDFKTVMDFEELLSRVREEENELNIK